MLCAGAGPPTLSLRSNSRAAEFWTAAAPARSSTKPSQRRTPLGTPVAALRPLSAGQRTPFGKARAADPVINLRRGKYRAERPNVVVERSCDAISNQTLFPDQHAWQRCIELAEKCITDAGKTAEEAQIEPAFAAVPSVVAGRGGALHDRREPPCGEVGKIGAVERAGRFAHEFDAAQRSTAQGIDTAGWALRNADGRIADIGGQRGFCGFRIVAAATLDADPRQADAGRAMAPLARPDRRAGAQIRPVVTAGIVARVLERDAFGGSSGEVVPTRGGGKRRECVGKAGGPVRHAVQRAGVLSLTGKTAAAVIPDAALAEQMLAAFDRAG